MTKKADADLKLIKSTLVTSRQRGNPLILIVEEGIIDVEAPKLKGEQIYPRMEEIVKDAKSEVLIMGYKLDAKSDGETHLKAALASLSKTASQSGIKIVVRILINRRSGLASVVKPNNPSAEHYFRELSPDAYPHLDFQYIEHSHDAFGSFHSKMIIVDNETAILSSGDMMQVDNYSHGKSGWVECGSFLHGAGLVTSMRREFIRSYYSKNSNPVQGIKKDIPEFESKEKSAETDSKLLQTTALFISKKSNGNIHKQDNLSPFALALITAIKSAQTCISIMTPNMNVEAIIQALADAHARGVQINIIVGKHMGDELQKRMGGTNQNGMQRLFDAIGKRKSNPLANLDIRWATDDSGKSIIPERHINALHARVSCIDDLVFVGSSVCDKQSIYHSKEADVIMASAEVRKLYMDTVFLPHFNKGVKLQDDPYNIIKFSGNFEPIDEKTFLKQKNLIIVELNKLSAYKAEKLKNSGPFTLTYFGGRDVGLESDRLNLMAKAAIEIEKANDPQALDKAIIQILNDNIILSKGLSKEDSKFTDKSLSSSKPKKNIKFGKIHTLLKQHLSASAKAMVDSMELSGHAEEIQYPSELKPKHSFSGSSDDSEDNDLTWEYLPENDSSYTDYIFHQLQLKQNSLFSHWAKIDGISMLEPLDTHAMHSQPGQLIKSAESEVLMQFYKFGINSDAGKIITNALKELQAKATKEQKPVVVNILINTRGKISEIFYKKNDDGGITALKELNCQYFQVNVTHHRAEALGSFHSKFVIVDGRQVTIRGGDPGDNDFKDHRIETGLLSDGPLAREVRKEFVNSWNRYCEPSLKMQHLDHKEVKQKEIRQPQISGIFIAKAANGHPRIRVTMSEGGPLKIALIESIKYARYSINILTANLNDPQIIAALVQACNRGVYVNIVMEKHRNDITESKLGAGGKNMTHMTELVKKVNPSRLSYLNIRWATNPQGTIVKHKEPFGVHGKYACIDNRLVLTGSTPLDMQGLYHSKEADFIFDSKDKAEEFNRVLFNDKFESSKDYHTDVYEEVLERLTRLIGLNTALQDSLHDCVRQIETSDIREYNKTRQLLVHMLPIIKQSGIKTEEFIKIINEEYAIRKVPVFTEEMVTYRYSESRYPLIRRPETEQRQESESSVDPIITPKSI